MTSPPLSLPKTLGGHYRLEREVGAGGMAVVYAAHDLKHDRAVAVKVLRPEVAASVGAERFLREIRVSARLNHPNILPLRDSGEAGGILYYIMPLIEGESLRERLTREGRLPIEAALTLTTQVGGALEYAHRRGVIHRDIKPENILLHEGTALVADFGVALALHAPGKPRLTQSGFMVGTPLYVSPEQALGEADLDHRSDQYSLACVLYEMLIGEPPHPGTSAQAVLAKVMMDPPPSARRLRHTIPLAVDAALQRALATSAPDRFASVQEFIQALSLPAPRRPSRWSVAVLPFVNLSPDPENEYFADGVTEDVITHLSKIRSLKVISRTSVMAFKGRPVSLAEVAASLGVGAVVEGSIRRSGNRVRIVAQLIDAPTDQHLWAETYDRDLADVFSIQTEVALAVARALEAKLTASEEESVRARPTRNLEAYDLYLLGQHHWFQFTADGADRAGEYFQRAIEQDPGFAPAHGGLANYFLMVGGAPLNVLPAAWAVPQAKQAAQHALTLDPTLGSAWSALALAQCWFDWDWFGALETARQGVECCCNNPMLWSTYVLTHDVVGQHAEAIRGVSHALQLDPLSVLMLQNAAWVSCHARRYEEAQDYLDQLMGIRPNFPIGVFTQAELLLAQGKEREAIAAIEPLSDVMSLFDYGMAMLAMAYGRTGHRADARRIAGQLEAQCREGRAAWGDVALAHLGMGDLDRAMDFVEAIPHQRPPGGFIGAYLGVLPLFDPIRDDARFQAVLARMKLPAGRLQPVTTDVGNGGHHGLHA
jgi:serine/threonine-protein kinase